MNPAKPFLRRYIALTGRVDALQRAIDQAYERATNISVTLKEVQVMSSPAEPDRMAKEIVNAADACEILYKYKAEAEAALREILEAIDSLTDERQKELLTRRYINGESFFDIMDHMGYEKTQTYVIHGRALMGIWRWLDGRSM